MNLRPIQALCFDLFGTVVDWRTSIIEEGRTLGRELGIDRDWVAFADAWRGRYQPSMERVRSGRAPWRPLDELHLESLHELAAQHDIELSAQQADHFNRAWHRLQPWPDSIPGLTALASHYTLATMSNANIELATNMAANVGLPWHRVLGAEVARAYKPMPIVYRRSVAELGLEPEQCMMVAAHNYDLRAAKDLGFATAFIPRVTEYGPSQTTDLTPDGPWDVVAADLIELARLLGARSGGDGDGDGVG